VVEHAWLALLAEGVTAGSGEPHLAAAARHLDGAPAGQLVTWRQVRRPHSDALRVSPHIVADQRRPPVSSVDAPTGPWAVSLAIAPRGRRPLFDDPAVVQAARTVMSDTGRAAAFSTLVIDAVHWAGAVSAVPANVADRWPGWWETDPYDRLAPTIRLIVEPGVLVAAPLPAGPGTQRYYGSPWPAGSFTS